MPLVDGKKFPYTKSGKAAAKKALLKKIVQSKGKKKGGKPDFMANFAKKK